MKLRVRSIKKINCYRFFCILICTLTVLLFFTHPIFSFDFLFFFFVIFCLNLHKNPEFFDIFVDKQHKKIEIIMWQRQLLRNFCEHFCVLYIIYYQYFLSVYEIFVEIFKYFCEDFCGLQMTISKKIPVFVYIAYRQKIRGKLVREKKSYTA